MVVTFSNGWWTRTFFCISEAVQLFIEAKPRRSHVPVQPTRLPGPATCIAWRPDDRGFVAPSSVGVGPEIGGALLQNDGHANRVWHWMGFPIL